MTHPIDEWVKALRDAGWIEERLSVWRCPLGYLWRGPYGAYCELQRRKKS